MDYKLMRRAILICSLSVLAILAMVLWGNREALTGQTKEQASQATANVQESAEQEMLSQSILSSGDLRAFLYDEDFWDDDPLADRLTDDRNAIRVSLIATSIQKDLRLQIVDSNGDLVAGEPFFVTIEDVGQFKDLDRDGIIYISDLSAGDYQVSIDPLDGYHVATSSMKVHVSDTLAYKTIDDIALFIRSESEIDVENDSVNGRDLGEDADSTEITYAYEDLKDEVFGIDVSSHNGDIDWNKVRASGVEFAIIRCGYRGYTSGALVEDSKFIRNIIGAKEAGIKVGIYFFTQAISEVEAVEEASMVVTLCRDYQVDLPIFIDAENTGANGRADGIDGELRTRICVAFCETLENAGYRAGVYSNKYWLNNILDVPQISKYIIWLAQYKAKADYKGDYAFWQYSSNGWIEGITGRVDLDIGNLTYRTMYEAQEETPTPTPTPISEETPTPTTKPQESPEGTGEGAQGN